MLPAAVDSHVGASVSEPHACLCMHGKNRSGNLGALQAEGEEALETSSDNEEMQCAATLRLHEDYPEPLTRAQRELLYRHTATMVHRFEMLRKGTRIVERGYNSLKSLLARLEEERTRLQTSLDELLKQEEAESSATSHTESTASRTEAKPTPSRRRPGGLLCSAAFANMHNILNAAKREEQQQRLNVTLGREKIGKTTQLKIINDDLAEQKQYLAPLTEKYEKSRALLEMTKGKVLEVLRLYDEMHRMEVLYASRFFLRASGAQGGEEGAETAAYDVFFAPARYTDEVQDMIREQVEETLGEYLAYRARVDPVLESLAEERRNREAKRADQLLQLIGVDTENIKVAASADLGFATSLVTTTITDATPPALKKKDGTTAVAGQISDTEDDYDDNDPGDEPQERRQRDQIQSALAALDDFEELY
ncbi:hypothetical protein TraAM80_00611 [Trypanosoma rangeli]|uniref:Uncharacterized protein n=1 Tax=Trypanosoma rangeli TaxID=5698 RepID=A0A3R7P2X0_TRYRA|nr:uncharacterized protein TraAM80_00611 [Trypanosoma rangeli]RNF11916.1 hypothetical protein TraAM80_00611 [Trypanosoma rangeli]|eukprot:RNF11916.1 hypothetical protein TraAM80_00611 [Trypanosoma rangeli]